MKFIEGRTAERAEHPGQACLNRGGGERQLGGKCPPCSLFNKFASRGAGVRASSRLPNVLAAPRLPARPLR